jgi:hypothetical protein
MRFHYAQPPEMGCYAAPDPYGYGYYGQEPYLAEEYPPAVGDPYGYYAQPPQMAPQMAPYAGPAFYGQAPYQPGYGQAEPAPVGYYAEEYPVGYYGEEYPMQGYGEEYPMGHYAEETPYGPMGQPQEPVGYYAEEYPVGYYGEEYPMQGYGEEYPMGHYAEETPYGPMGEPQEPGYGQVPEMVGYGAYAPLEQGYPGVGYYGYDEPDLTGYVRETEPTFNAGCPLPTNVPGVGEAENLEGYIKPTTVNPICPEFTPQPGPTPSAPESFRPLW